MTVVGVTAVLLLLLLSAGLSAAAAAIFSVGESRIRTLVDEGFRGAPALAQLRDDPQPLAVIFLILNTTVNALTVGLVVGLTRDGASLGQVAITAVAAGLVVLAVGELVPKALAVRHRIRFALVAAPPFALLARFARAPLVPLAHRTIVPPERDATAETRGEEAEREVRELAALGHKEGVVDEQERLLVERAFRLDELRTWDVMTPRVDVFAWPHSRRLEDIVGELESVPFSRVPVFGQTIDDITGILYVRDAYEAYAAGRKDARLSQLCREPFFVPGSLPVLHLLRSFQTRRIHMGIVTDEFGGTDGVVTLEDVLEELVGDIADETDVAEEPIARVSRNEIIADGGVELREINHALNVSLPHFEHRSLNGYILEELGRVPDRAEAFERAGLQIEILDASETQVIRARLRKLPAAGDSEAA